MLAASASALWRLGPRPRPHLRTALCRSRALLCRCRSVGKHFADGHGLCGIINHRATRKFYRGYVIAATGCWTYGFCSGSALESWVRYIARGRNGDMRILTYKVATRGDSTTLFYIGAGVECAWTVYKCCHRLFFATQILARIHVSYHVERKFSTPR